MCEWTWLGGSILVSLCWGVEKRQTVPLLGVGRIYQEGRARGKFCNHGRNSQALLVFLLFWLLFFLPGLSLLRAHICTKFATGGDVIMKFIVDGVMVNFMCQLKKAKAGAKIFGQILFWVCL